MPGKIDLAAAPARGSQFSGLCLLRHPRPRHSQSERRPQTGPTPHPLGLAREGRRPLHQGGQCRGAAMQYHPHGDASISDALVVLANKRYLIEGQGNFGNIFTGDVPAAAPRYIECRLTELARAEAFQRRNHRFRAQLRRPHQGAGHAAQQTAAAAHAGHRRHRRRHVGPHSAA